MWIATWLMLADPTVLTVERVHFASGTREKIRARAKSIDATPVRPIGEAIASPDDLPYPLPRRSRFSTLYRARDLFDVALFPATAVTKLHRLDADGKRTEHACTAQFVGQRHLITAAHCIVYPFDRTPHAGFEIAVGYDNGGAMMVAPVVDAWIDDQPGLATDQSLALVTPERCSDFALLAIAEPVGERTGWLGIRACAAAATPLHRFSYPHVPGHRALERTIGKMPEGARKAFETELARSRTTEPDFSPDNLYYEFGRADHVASSHLADTNGYIAPGRSCAALVDSTGTVQAILSRGYDGTSYSCRLTPELIGALAAIIAGKDP